MRADVEGQIRWVDRHVEMGQEYVYKLQRSENPEQSILSETVYIPVTRGALLQNYRNPVNPTTRITYYVPEGPAQRVTLIIYVVTGARVRTLVNGVVKAGRYVEVWEGRNNDGNTVGSGVYFYQLRVKGFVDTKKMVLLK